MKHNRLCPICKQDVVLLDSQQQSKTHQPSTNCSTKLKIIFHRILSRLLGISRNTRESHSHSRSDSPSVQVHNHLYLMNDLPLHYDGELEYNISQNISLHIVKDEATQRSQFLSETNGDSQ